MLAALAAARLSSIYTKWKFDIYSKWKCSVSINMIYEVQICIEITGISLAFAGFHTITFFTISHMESQFALEIKRTVMRMC